MPPLHLSVVGRDIKTFNIYRQYKKELYIITAKIIRINATKINQNHIIMQTNLKLLIISEIGAYF